MKAPMTSDNAPISASVALALRAVSAASLAWAFAASTRVHHLVDTCLGFGCRQAGARCDQLLEIGRSSADISPEAAPASRMREAWASIVAAASGHCSIGCSRRGGPEQRVDEVGRGVRTLGCARHWPRRRVAATAPAHRRHGARAGPDCRGQRRTEHAGQQQRCQRPRQEAMGGIAEEYFVGVDADPFGPEPAGHIAGEACRDPLHEHQPTAVETAMVVRLAPSLDHGETMVRPRPEPSSIRSSVAAAAASAPAMIGPQLTAVADDSSGHGGCDDGNGRFHARPLVPEQQDEDDDRNRDPEKPEQNSAAHDCLLRM